MSNQPQTPEMVTDMFGLKWKKDFYFGLSKKPKFGRGGRRQRKYRRSRGARRNAQRLKKCAS